MPRKRGPSRKASVTKRIKRFKEKYTHHVTPVQMKELLDEAKALLEEWLVNYDAVEVEVLADLEIKIVAALKYADIKVYPWAGTVVLDADPDYTYTVEVSQAGVAYKEVDHFDFDSIAGDIKSVFVHLVWAMKITGAGSGKVKWQIASGSNASPGAYVDITDEVTETIGAYSDHGRSGIVHKITNIATTVPFTIRCLVANIDATSAEAKIKSNSYIRVAYKRS